MTAVPIKEALDGLCRSNLPVILFVGHGIGGGVGRHIEELAAGLKGAAEILLLEPVAKVGLSLRSMNTARGLQLWFDAAADWEALVQILRAIAVDRVHFHHIDGLPQTVLNLPKALSCPHDVTLHDYFPACPNYHLTDGNGRYCGQDPECTRCVELRDVQWPVSIQQWRRLFGVLLAEASRVIAPSCDTATRLRRFFPYVTPVVWHHPERWPEASLLPLRVLVLGAISREKGVDVLQSCVQDANMRRLPLHFRVLGYLGKPISPWPRSHLSVAGEYRDGDLEYLVDVEHGDAIFFPSQCPETYSYTLSAALNSGLPIVATDLGAFPERLAGHANATVVRWNASAGEMNDAILASVPARTRTTSTRPLTSFEDYRERYMLGVDRRPAPREVLPTIHEAWSHKPQLAQQQHPFAFLYEDGVLCGKASSLEMLRQYAYDPDRAQAAADARFRELTRAYYSLREEQQNRPAGLRETLQPSPRLLELERELNRLRNSRSWRLTAPLRALAHGLRRFRK